MPWMLTGPGEATLQRSADAWGAKYGSHWRYVVSGGVFRHAEGSRRGDPAPAVICTILL